MAACKDWLAQFGGISTNHQEIMLVGPAKRLSGYEYSVYECILKGAAYAIVDADAMPPGMQAPLWVQTRLRA